MYGCKARVNLIHLHEFTFADAKLQNFTYTEEDALMKEGKLSQPTLFNYCTRYLLLSFTFLSHSAFMLPKVSHLTSKNETSLPPCSRETMEKTPYYFLQTFMLSLSKYFKVKSFFFLYLSVNALRRALIRSHAANVSTFVADSGLP